MGSILASLSDHPEREFAAGDLILEQGGRDDLLYFLIEGEVEILKDDVKVATASHPGDIFGDLSVLLGVPHTATVRATRPCRFFVVSDSRAFLERTPPVCLHLCELLARRLDTLNKYLVDVRHQFQGEDHIGMVDQVLDTLMHRHPRPRVAPKASTLRDPEVMD